MYVLDIEKKYKLQDRDGELVLQSLCKQITTHNKFCCLFTNETENTNDCSSVPFLTTLLVVYNLSYATEIKSNSTIMTLVSVYIILHWVVSITIGELGKNHHNQ